ncbi:acyltransferase family protein [Sphingomonas xanthus]|nr:acyltransferase [Sphingomonas xanthus]
MADSRPARPAETAAALRAGDKLLGLEVLRLLSALAVLFYHYRHFAHMAGMAAVDRAAVPGYGMLWPFYEYGQFGVQVFWGISGYIFFWKYGQAIHHGAVRTKEFFWLRFSRLYPLHVLTLVAVVGLQAVHRSTTGEDFIYPASEASMLVAQLFLATDWGPAQPFSFNGPIWSISAEVAVYAAFFIILRRFPPTIKLCVGVIAFSLAAQIAGLGWVSISCAAYFFAGGLAAFAPPGKYGWAVAGLATLLMLSLAGGMLGNRSKLPMLIMAAVPLVLVVAARDWPLLGRAAPAIRAAGNLTYSSYLLHFPLQLMLAIAVASTALRPSLANPLFLAAYIAATLLAAMISYRWIEMPAQQWIRGKALRRA